MKGYMLGKGTNGAESLHRFINSALMGSNASHQRWRFDSMHVHCAILMHEKVRSQSNVIVVDEKSVHFHHY